MRTISERDCDRFHLTVSPSKKKGDPNRVISFPNGDRFGVLSTSGVFTLDSKLEKKKKFSG